MSFPIKVSETASYGSRRRIQCNASLFKNGEVIIEATSTCDNNHFGIKGAHVWLLLIDEKGNCLWVTKQFKCKTVGGRWDPTTPSSHNDVFHETIPGQVASLVSNIDILFESGPNPDSRSRIIEAIKTADEIGQEIKELAIKYLH